MGSGLSLNAVRRRMVMPPPSYPWGGAVVGGVVLVVVWGTAAAFFTSPSGRPGAVPSPQLVLRQFIAQLGDGVYWRAIGDTGGAAVHGFVWGNAIGLMMALLVMLVPRLGSLVLQVAVIASCVPITAVAPIVTLMQPAGSRVPSVFLAAMLCIFTTLIGAVLGLRSARSAQLDLVTVYGGGRWARLRKVQLIAALPSILAALKLAAPAAFLGALLGEYFLVGVDSGIGILLLAAQSTSASVRVWALALLCVVLAGSAYALLGLIEKLATPWSSGETTTLRNF